MDSPDPQPVVPAGFRQGLISAITVLLGFSLLFVRFWTFEAEGQWSPSSVAAGLLLAVAVLLQIATLWRALQVRDEAVREYEKTLRWFLGSTVVLMVSVFLAALSSALS
jgi:hypothetical protein